MANRNAMMVGLLGPEVQPSASPRGLMNAEPVTTADINRMMSQTLVRRGTILPFSEYADGSARFDWDAGIAAPFGAINRMLKPGYDYSNTRQAAGDALNASSFAFTGGLGANAAGLVPRGAVGSSGGRMLRGNFDLEIFPGQPVPILSNPSGQRLAAFIRQTPHKAVRVLDDPETGVRYVWPADAAALHRQVAEKLGIKFDPSGPDAGKILTIED